MNDVSTNGVATNGHATTTPSPTEPLPVAPIDEELKGGNWLNELERAELLAEREARYLAASLSPHDFIKDTAEKTKLSRAVLQRVRRITRLPKEVVAVLKGTKIADRQDLLVWLSDQIDDRALSIEDALLETRKLIENPPAYGPRSTPKRSTPAEIAEASTKQLEAAGELNVEILEGLPIALTFPDGKPRIQDLELGAQLGFSRARDIRKLIGDLVAGGHLLANELCDRPSQTPRTAGRPAKERWLDEEQALFVTTQAGTPIARTITRQVIRAFVAARRRLDKPAADLAFAGRIGERLVNEVVIPLDGQLKQIERRLVALEGQGSFGSKTMLLVPQVDPEDAGYSMEALNRALSEKGFNISENDTALRSFAAKLGLIGDLNYGFWNAHSDRVNRSLSDSWRFNDVGAQALEPFAIDYCKRKMQYEEEGQPAPRDRALKEVLDTIVRIGTGEHVLLTRTRALKARQPFPALRGPND